jgi:pyruvate kinase
MLSHLRKTKIVATLGPSINQPETLEKALLAGIDVCRVNCSHSDAAGIRKSIALVRRTAAKMGRSVGILLDLQGPKIRCGVIDGKLHLKKKDVLTVVMDKEFTQDGNRIGTTWVTMINDVAIGERVLFADGALTGTVLDIRRDSNPGEIDIEIEVGGELSSRKGINLPDSNIQAPALTPKDEGDLVVGLAAGVDFVALSFVRHGDDVRLLRKRLEENGQADIPIISKIDILEESDGIMVARGDLGVEIPISTVPVVQKELIQAAQKKGRLVITATQMLESMTHHPFPTRAEVTDVANAILDGSDAVMLSGETSVGLYPFRTIQMMSSIAYEIESSSHMQSTQITEMDKLKGSYNTVVRAACYAAQEGDRPMVVFTWSGNAALVASRSRPPKPIFAVTPSRMVADKLRLVWGVYAVVVPHMDSTEELIHAAEEALKNAGFVQTGDEVVILGGTAPIRGAANLMKIEIID